MICYLKRYATRKIFRELVAAALPALLVVPILASAKMASNTATAVSPGKVIRAPLPATTELSPIVVEGVRMPMPVALQMLKNALARPWSGAWKDRNKPVCRTEPMLGSHFSSLRCQTNLEHFKEASTTQLALDSLPARGSGSEGCSLCAALNQAVPVEFVQWASGRRINPAGLHALLAKLPPAGSSYTLEMTDHGRVVSKWVFKKGKLVKVWHESKGGGTR